MHQTNKDTDSLQVKERKKKYHTDINQKKLVQLVKEDFKKEILQVEMGRCQLNIKV